jgi:hypothetical protein
MPKEKLALGWRANAGLPQCSNSSAYLDRPEPPQNGPRQETAVSFQRFSRQASRRQASRIQHPASCRLTTHHSPLTTAIPQSKIRNSNSETRNSPHSNNLCFAFRAFWAKPQPAAAKHQASSIQHLPASILLVLVLLLVLAFPPAPQYRAST